MKSILYLGVTLMAGASIYGIVDYQKTSRAKEFNNMYESKQEPMSATTPEIATVERGLPTASIDQPVVSKPAAVSSVHKKISMKRKSKARKNKKLDHRIFSRAPLREIELPDSSGTILSNEQH